jgi:DNA-binding transcriptional LysR family regulator
MTTQQQIHALQTGRHDAGLLRPVMTLTGLAFRVISRDPLVAVLPAGHRLADDELIPLAGLADDPFVFFFRNAGPIVHDTIVGYCLAAGFSPRIVQEAQVQTIPALVAANLGVSLLIAPPPRTTIEPLSTVRYRTSSPPWDMALAWSASNPSPTLARLLAVAETA